MPYHKILSRKDNIVKWSDQLFNGVTFSLIRGPAHKVSSDQLVLIGALNMNKLSPVLCQVGFNPYVVAVQLGFKPNVRSLSFNYKECDV